MWHARICRTAKPRMLVHGDVLPGAGRPSDGRNSVNDLTSAASWKAALAEFLATFMFVVIGVGAVGASLDIVGQPQTLFYIAAAHGIGIGLGFVVVARISGGHLNPAVTISAVLAGRMGVTKAAMYIVAQLAAGAAASFIVKSVAFSNDNLGVHRLGNRVTSGEGLIIEVIITFILVFVVFAAAMDKRSNALLAPIAIGLAIMAGHLVALPMTGASMNPARSFGTALAYGAWADHWIYWVGPILGGVIAAVAYTTFFGEKADQDKLGKVSM